MASAKSNIRSFRFSDEVAAILEKQKGDSMNAKFENLVLRCFWELPKCEDDLAQIYKDIDSARQKLWDTRKAVQEIDNVMSSLKSAQHYLGIVGRGAQKIAKAAGLDVDDAV